MKKTRKIISMLLAAAMLTGISGCGAKKVAKDGEVPTLIWLLPGDKQEDMDLVLAEANKIVEEEIGAKIQIEMIDSGAFTNRLNLKMSSKEYFDICFTGWLNPYVKGVRMGGYAPMTELIEEYAPELLKQFPDYAVECAKVDNEIYAIPSLQILAEWSGIWVDAAYYEKYGFDQFEKIENLRDLEPCFDKVLANETGVYPINKAYASMQDYWVISYTPDLLMKKGDPENKIVWRHTLEESEAERQRVRDWYLKGYIRPDIDTAPGDSEEIKAGRYATFFGSYKPGMEADYKTQYGRDYIFIPTGDPIIPQGAGIQSMTAISANSENKEKSIQFIELMNTNAELYNLIAFGLEGKHYEMLEDGKHIKLIKDSGYDAIDGWKLGNQFLSYFTEGQDDTVWEETQKINESAELSPLLGLTFNSDPVKTYTAQVSAADPEFGSMHKGSLDYTKYYDKYIEKLTAAGTYKIIEEYQRQVDEFIASKK